MNIYDQGSEPLHDLLRTASSERATLLIPDLQRPYVWNPSQVILLVDSLLRGWPFGTLLLWNVNKEELASIPSRSFWRVVDRTGEFDDAQVGKSNPPAVFRMVLDGQQRLQSLLLALGGDAWGFRLLDHEWSTVLEAERPRGRNAKRHWSLGHLCLDVRAFQKQWAVLKDVAKLDFRDVLQWVVQSPSEGRSTLKRPVNYKHPLPSALDPENHGRFIRLSRLWDLAGLEPGLRERHFRERLEPVLTSHDVPEKTVDEVLAPLAELQMTLVELKQSKVSYLQVAPYSNAYTQDLYNDAIVNIFTRLNTAGRALTRQEITFAWIKTGWDASQAGGHTAGVCFELLREDLADEDVTLDVDEVVGVISAMWSVLCRNGEVLTANDLLRGEKVRPMAQDLVPRWDVIRSNAVAGADLVGDQGLLYGTQYRSLNVLTLLLCWRLVGRQWLAEHPLGVTQKDGFVKSLDAEFRKNCARWVLLSQWSGRWGRSTDKTFADYLKDLAADWKSVSSLEDPDSVLAVLAGRMAQWLASLRPEAEKHVTDLAVLSRDHVHQYYLPLWLWHRLDEERWRFSAIPLRESKRGRSPAPEVDHIVAVKLWEKLVVPVGADDGSEDDASTVINALGNCNLLEKSFNVAKGADPLESFLVRVHEFKTSIHPIVDWCKALDIPEALLDPTKVKASSNAVTTAIGDRTARMKKELIEYIGGTRQRADIT